MIIRLPRLHTVQRRFAEEIISSTARYAIVCCSRQWGKSYLIKALALYYASSNAETVTMIISMTYSQVLKVFNELSKALKGTPILKEVNKGEWTIRLFNDSEIIFKSYQNLDLIRGYSVDYLLVDEAAYAKENDFNAALRPTLTVKGKKAILVSTPRGKNFFYKLFMEGKNGNPNYVSFQSNWRDNPFAQTDEIDDAKRLLPEGIYQSEYEAVFVADGMSVFKGFRECVNTGNWKKGELIAGVDVGRDNDSSVLTIMDGNKVVLQEYYRQISYIEIAKKIASRLKEYNVRQCHTEYNGVGSPFFDILKDCCKQMAVTIIPWTTTNQSKENAVLRLVQDIAERNIILPDDSELLFQMENFEAHFSNKSKAVIYENRVDSIHDDRVMSLCVCNYNRHKAVNYGKYAVV